MLVSLCVGLLGACVADTDDPTIEELEALEALEEIDVEGVEADEQASQLCIAYQRMCVITNDPWYCSQARVYCEVA